MSKPQVLSEKPVSLSQTNSEISKIKKRDEGLNFRAQKVEEYLQQSKPLSTKKADDLVKALEKLDIPRLKEIHIIKIVDLLPQKIEDLKVILQGYVQTINADNMKKIIEVVSKQA
ncbi:hypothetical protein GOV04_00475 [Candidatus Woesearchaeota archaeon]|nr:hypothetical protein [Candidatus Woesearchaeota archaeon]